MFFWVHPVTSHEHHLRCMSENWFMSGAFDWASQLGHFKKGNYPPWKILAHARVKITGIHSIHTGTCIEYTVEGREEHSMGPRPWSVPV